MTTSHRASMLDGVALISAVAQGAFALNVWLNGPTGPLPVHFDLAGQVDRWGDRNEVALTLGGLAILGFLINGGLGLAAQRSDAAGDVARRRGLRAGQVVSILAFVGVTLLIASVSLGDTDLADAPGTITAGLGLLLAMIGAGLGRVGPNPVVGVRTPWTYKSRLAWDRSNRLAGRLFLLIGMAAVAASPLAPQPVGLFALFAAIVVAAVWSVVESWRVWRTDPDRQPF